MSQPPLTGVRILDLTQFMSGPFGTQILGDLGAEVIKIEPPEGELARHIPPHFVRGDSAYYLCLNRNKDSIAIDLQRDEGKSLLRGLALKSDVVIENFRPGVVGRLGLDVEKLRVEKPGLIWCSISGFGQDGPYRDLPAYDMVVQAISGGMSLTGETDARPVRAGIPIGDLAAGLYAVIAVLAALRSRDETGHGDCLDISMLDCQVALLTYQAAYFLQGGPAPGPQGRGHASIPTYRAFAAADGREVVIAASTERMWRELTKVLELEALLEDPRFSTNECRNANRQELWPLLEAAFARRDASYWVETLRRISVPVGTINTIDQVLADPQVLHRGMVMSLDANDGTEIRVAGNPVRFRNAGMPRNKFPPKLGEDRSEVLARVLGMRADEVAALVSRGVLSHAAPNADGSSRA